MEHSDKPTKQPPSSDDIIASAIIGGFLGGVIGCILAYYAVLVAWDLGETPWPIFIVLAATFVGAKSAVYYTKAK